MRINFTKSGRLCYTNIRKSISNRFKWLYQSYPNYIMGRLGSGVCSTLKTTLCWAWRWKLMNKNKSFSNIFSHTVTMYVWKLKKGSIQLVIWVNFAKLNCLQSFVKKKKEKRFQISAVKAIQNTFETSRQKTEITRRYL